ncbi:hypothetical protein WICPIJ_002988 [Wickerhamomyces pijperi]|uniref:Uncharacterized protein n=1 Tax=Wickerhamomyces pijperi TaxID=599730 RepID=A0A9P8QAP8_WICPI|nr:hypothetical protein WICPIJ_002988 [Wickerhamomyces pijperi]
MSLSAPPTAVISNKLFSLCSHSFCWVLVSILEEEAEEESLLFKNWLKLKLFVPVGVDEKLLLLLLLLLWTLEVFGNWLAYCWCLDKLLADLTALKDNNELPSLDEVDIF